MNGSYARGPVRLSLRDALVRLRAPLSLEEFSPLTGAEALVIELDRDDAAGATADDVAAAVGHLRMLPCPSIGVGTDPAFIAGATPTPATKGGVSGRFVDALDVVVTDGQLERVLEGVARSPLAALALVQLLRLGEKLDVYEALIAESLVYSTLQSGPEFQCWLSSRKPAPAASPKTGGPPVVSRRSEKRLEIVLDRPERRNAYSAEMRDGLSEALEVAVADASIEEITLRGNGACFSAGGDLAEFGTLPDPASAHAVRSTRSAARLLAECAERVRVDVHGACIGAGVELPAFARRVVARRDAYFQLPELSMGLVPGAGGTASIPRRIGRHRAAYMALTGIEVDAATALAWGLVDSID